jgi:hypothetical protein
LWALITFRDGMKCICGAAGNCRHTQKKLYLIYWRSVSGCTPKY